MDSLGRCMKLGKKKAGELEGIIKRSHRQGLLGQKGLLGTTKEPSFFGKKKRKA